MMFDEDLDIFLEETIAVDGVNVTAAALQAVKDFFTIGKPNDSKALAAGLLICLGAHTAGIFDEAKEIYRANAKIRARRQ